MKTYLQHNPGCFVAIIIGVFLFIIILILSIVLPIALGSSISISITNDAPATLPTPGCQYP
jgi:hypothetical protein